MDGFTRWQQANTENKHLRSEHDRLTKENVLLRKMKKDNELEHDRMRKENDILRKEGEKLEKEILVAKGKNKVEDVTPINASVNPESTKVPVESFDCDASCCRREQSQISKKKNAKRRQNLLAVRRKAK